MRRPRASSHQHLGAREGSSRGRRQQGALGMALSGEVRMGWRWLIIWGLTSRPSWED